MNQQYQMQNIPVNPYPVSDAPLAGQSGSSQKFDIRQYIGLFVFYWRLIGLSVLLCLAGAAIYVQYFPKVYAASCAIMITTDPYVRLGSTRAHTPLQRWSGHSFLLRSRMLRERAAAQLRDEWGSHVLRGGAESVPPVNVGRLRGLSSTLNISVRGSDREYLQAFLKALLVEHEAEWRDQQTESSDNAIAALEVELRNFESKIARAEDDLIEFQRLHDIARIEAFGAQESRQLTSLINRRGSLVTQIMMLESQYPFLKDAELGVIDSVDMLTRETAWLAAMDVDEDIMAASGDFGGSSLHPLLYSAPRDDASAAAMRGWQELRVELARLLEQEAQLAENFTIEHPRRVALRKSIEDVRERIDRETRVRMQRLLDRREAMEIQLKALQDAEESWQARNLLASRRKSELNRLQGVLRRFESNYATLYGRLHDLRVAREVNVETFTTVQEVSSPKKPVWPDPFRIFAIALALGLGGSVGLTLLLDYFGNRIQFPRDIEQELQQPFLAGIPYWAHQGLENMARPTVIDEANPSAVEAYRTLRSVILDALEDAGENTVLVASADSREGKTLTVLNTAILTAKLGKRVLLLDMDLRRGRLHRSLDLNREPGISGALRDGTPLHDIIVPTRFDNLYFIPSGDDIDDAAELLSDNRFKRLLEPLKSEFDYIFVDTPPILRASEAMIMCNQRVGGVVFVARVNKSSIPLVRYALKMVREARVLGVVVNYIELHRISSLYYVYSYPNASYNYYEYGRYGNIDAESRLGKMWGKARHRSMRWIRRKLLS